MSYLIWGFPNAQNKFVQLSKQVGSFILFQNSGDRVEASHPGQQLKYSMDAPQVKITCLTNKCIVIYPGITSHIQRDVVVPITPHIQIYGTVYLPIIPHYIPN